MYTYTYIHSKKSYEEIFTLTCCLSDTLCVCLCWTNHGVTTVSRIDSIIGLFCRILSLLLGSFAKETYNFIDPTNRSHPILTFSEWWICMNMSMYIYMHILTYHICFIQKASVLYRVANTHRIPYLSFPTQDPCKKWLFCRKRPENR